jgi:hypothetical protein
MGRRIAGLVFGLLGLTACADLANMPRPPTEAEQCRAWGYAPDDPECRRVFHRDRA